MSAQLARLRRLFNDPLLTASGRKLVPTARVLEIRQPLRALLADLDQLAREGRQFDPATTDQSFRLIGIDYVHAVFASKLLSAFAAEAPNARLALLPFDPPAIWPQLAEDAAALALVTGLAPPDDRRRPGLSEQFKIIQRRAHPRGDAPFSFEAFFTVEHALVSPEGGGFIGAMD